LLLILVEAGPDPGELLSELPSLTPRWALSRRISRSSRALVGDAEVTWPLVLERLLLPLPSLHVGEEEDGRRDAPGEHRCPFD
jgi:hypothetical protein